LPDGKPCPKAARRPTDKCMTCGKLSVG
jgi:hypothetical protein